MSDFEMPIQKPDVSTATFQDTAASPEKAKDKEADKKPKYTEEELNRVFDEIMFVGNYSEQMKLKGGRLVVRFRSRTAEEVNAITDKLDARQANLLATVSDNRAVMNLEYALQEFQGNDLTRLSHEDRSKYIGKLTGVVVALLVNAMNTFDQKVYEACKDAEINF